MIESTARWMFCIGFYLPLNLILLSLMFVGKKAEKLFDWCDECFPKVAEPEWMIKRRVKKQAIEQERMVERLTGRCQKR